MTGTGARPWDQVAPDPGAFLAGLAWSREEEFRWGYLRPAAVIDVAASADAAGQLTGWSFTNINSGQAGIATRRDQRSGGPAPTSVPAPAPAIDPSGRHGLGLACGQEKDSRVATAAEVRVGDDGTLHVLRLVTAFDCGAVVDPANLANQVEGATVMGLGGALFEQVDFADGMVCNASLSQYRGAPPAGRPARGGHPGRPPGPAVGRRR